MRLLKGWLPFWLGDVQQYFSQSPQDFAMFYYLLSNAHNEPVPYETLISGKTQKKENYKQKWSIARGDYIGSKKEIREFWKFHVHSQKKILASLVEKELIEVLLEDPCLIIRIPKYEEFVFAGKHEDRFKIEYLTSSELNRGDSELNRGVFKNVQTENKTGVVPDKIEPNVISKSISKEKGGEGKGIPPFLNLNLEEGNGIGIGIGEGEPIGIEKQKEEGAIVPINAKMPPPEEVNRLAIDWHRRTKRRLPESSYTIEGHSKQIEYMLRVRSIEILRHILNWLEENPAKRLSKEFVTPWERDKKFFGERSFIQEAHQEISPILEKKMRQEKNHTEGKGRVDLYQKAANEEAKRQADESKKFRQEGKCLREGALIGISRKGIN